MKRTLLASIAFLALVGPAFAQTSTTVTTTTGAAPAGTTIVVQPEQRTRIHRYVTERRVKPVTVRERVTVGATLPADVELEAVPADWGPEFSRYRYIYSGDHVVLVEPSSRRVIQVIE